MNTGHTVPHLYYETLIWKIFQLCLSIYDIIKIFESKKLSNKISNFEKLERQHSLNTHSQN